MAHATVKGARYNVRVVQDLAANWSVEVYPVPREGEIKRSEPFKNWPVPLCIKICADTRADALVMGLEQMKKLGKIADFHIEESERPVPPPPPPKPVAKPDVVAKPAAAAKPDGAGKPAAKPAATPAPAAEANAKPAPAGKPESAAKPAPSDSANATAKPEAAKPEAVKAEP